MQQWEHCAKPSGTTQRPAPVAQQSDCNGVHHEEAKPLPPVISVSVSPIKPKDQSINNPSINPINTHPSPDHDYAARHLNQVKLPSLPPVTANNENGLPSQGSSDSAVNTVSTENPKDSTPKPPAAAAKKAVTASRGTKRTGQSRRNYSQTLMTHQYEAKEKNVVQKKGNNPKRYALCRECEGCLAPDCESCKSCTMWAEYKEQITLGRPTCDNRVCLNPINLYNTRVSGTEGRQGLKQEDGCCPLRVIHGNVYDFRCVFCKYLPRVGSANRSELYRHYSIYHFPNELNKEFGRNLKRCPVCKGDVKGSAVSHIGQTHNEVEKYLPNAAKIPMSVQGKSGGRKRRLKPFVAHSLTEVFPAIPQGWNPATRQFEDEEPEETPKTTILGFEIEELYEDEEPLFVSREDPVTMPDYTGDSAICGICKNNGKQSYFADIVDAVLHVHKVHEVLGGSQWVMLDADRMLKSGYLSLTAQVAQVPEVEAAPVDTVETVEKLEEEEEDEEEVETMEEKGEESKTDIIGSRPSQNLVELLKLQSQVTPAVGGEVMSSKVPSEVIV